MLEYMNQSNDSFLSCDKLKTISVFLKKGKTTQSRVMDFILTILSCIILKIDNQTYLYEFKDIFNDRTLKNIKDDLENLLHFKTKFFNFLIMELLLETIKKENNYFNKRIKFNRIMETSNKQCNKEVLQKKVKDVIKFLIFRKIKKSSYLHDDNSTLDWSYYKQKIDIILSNEICPRDNIINKNNVKKNNEENTINFIYHKTKNESMNNINNSKKSDSKIESNFYKTSSYTCFDYLCSKIYWLLCYAWLGIFIYYCCTSFFPIFPTLLNIIHKLINNNS